MLLPEPHSIALGLHTGLCKTLPGAYGVAAQTPTAALPCIHAVGSPSCTKSHPKSRPLYPNPASPQLPLQKHILHMHYAPPRTAALRNLPSQLWPPVLTSVRHLEWRHKLSAGNPPSPVQNLNPDRKGLPGPATLLPSAGKGLHKDFRWQSIFRPKAASLRNPKFTLVPSLP